MKCKKAQKWALFAFYGEATQREQRRLNKHIQHCPDCAAKIRDMKENLFKVKEKISRVPDFNWENSWKKIDAVLKREELKSHLKPRFLPAVPLRAAVFTAIFCLGILAGELIFHRPSPKTSEEAGLHPNIAGLLDRHLVSVRICLLEYLNFRDMKDRTDLLSFEKKHTDKLLFQNRLLKSYLKDSASPVLINLLEDLDILLQEVANLTPDRPEYMAYIKSLLSDSDIIFRLHYLRQNKEWAKDKKEILP
ncbi:MAG: hypothetical protein JXB26_12150 [Candidatus Aminicenantes bacterium]|nr:hypothetical protein [Candidatus Aminicenantes bacterium]